MKAAKEKLEIVLSAPVSAYRSGSPPVGGEVGERPSFAELRTGNGVWVAPKQSEARYGVKIPPADLPAEVSTQAGPRQFRSDIFKQTPPSFKKR